MYKGIATFAAQNHRFPANDVLACFPRKIKKPAIAILDDHFVEDGYLRSNELESLFFAQFYDKKNLIEYHLKFRDPLTSPSKSARRAERIFVDLTISGMIDNTKLVFCPILEDQLANKSDVFKAHAKAIKKATGCKVVRSSLTKPSYGGNFQERHGAAGYWTKPPKKRIYNPDGYGVDVGCPRDKYFHKMSSELFLKYVRNIKPHAAFIWYAPLQGFANSKSFNDKPPIEKREYFVSRQAQKNIKRLLKQRWR